MSKKMLIDASHPEETRVVVVNGTRVEELDFESANKRQLRGNVYLARVTRVEPSLQAAFVEYGGNRHGFLAFSEIHPDYYQIPHDDKIALQKDEEEAAKAAAEEEEDEKLDTKTQDSSPSDEADDDLDDDIDEDALYASEDDTDDSANDDDDVNTPTEEDATDEADEDVAAEQAKTASTRRNRTSRRRYKIQEVIKRGDILLIQAVKEERGNKGAAMTTYLSLAGRYCVLMPNTPRGGGISRKIANGSDRKRLKEIVSGLDVAKGMGVIVRTAGSKRTKIEIKRDFDYLTRLWDTIRETTMKSFAPALIHEEGNLVKRSLRDLYNKDIEEVLVQGEDEYKVAKDFIKMMMPSHAKNIKQYKDNIPLFLRYQVERQIEDSLSSVAQLKSGGYLVIHPTEALVSVDVNSGRSTKERNVERTALKTNLEAAEEIARQMRMRDLAGLIVIDFIDMDENRNNRAVEKRMKDALSQDRARVQMGRISQFGLMEISRQRRRRSLLEGSTQSCEHCAGVGRKRTTESSALKALRAVEEDGVRGRVARIRLSVGTDVANYLINEKRHLLTEIEDRTGLFVELVSDAELLRPDFKIEKLAMRSEKGPDPLEEIAKELKREQKNARRNKPKRETRDSDSDKADDDEQKDRSSRKASDEDDTGDGENKRRRRRGRRGGSRRRGRDNQDGAENAESNASNNGDENTQKDGERPARDDARGESDDKPKRSRNRNRNRGRSKDKNRNDESSDASAATSDAKQDVAAETSDAAKSKTADKPKRSTTRRKAPSKAKPAVESDQGEASKDAKPAEDAKPARKKRAPAKSKAPSKASAKAKADATDEKPAAKKAPAKKAAPKKAPAKKAAPKKAAATKKAPTKTKSETEPKPDSGTASKPARRKAPARKSPKSDDKAASEPKASKPKAAPKKAEASAPETPDDKPKAKVKGVKGWWSRKK